MVVVALGAVSNAAIVKSDRDIVLRITSATDDGGTRADGAIWVTHVRAVPTVVFTAQEAAADAHESESGRSAHCDVVRDTRAGSLRMESLCLNRNVAAEA
jgi:hypothetical protein